MFTVHINSICIGGTARGVGSDLASGFSALQGHEAAKSYGGRSLPGLQCASYASGNACKND